MIEGYEGTNVLLKQEEKKSFRRAALSASAETTLEPSVRVEELVGLGFNTLMMDQNFLVVIGLS